VSGRRLWSIDPLRGATGRGESCPQPNR
jgi:hypothetical protein